MEIPSTPNLNLIKLLSKIFLQQTEIQLVYLTNTIKIKTGKKVAILNNEI